MITKSFAAAFIIVVKTGKRGLQMKKTICIVLSALTALAVFAGCQKTPENPLIVEKNMENMLEKAQETEHSESDN